MHVCEQVLAGRRGWMPAHVDEEDLRERLEREAHRMRMAGVEARLDVRTARLGAAADAIGRSRRADHAAGAIVAATRGANPGPRGCFGQCHPEPAAKSAVPG